MMVFIKQRRINIIKSKLNAQDTQFITIKISKAQKSFVYLTNTCKILTIGQQKCEHAYKDKK